MMDKQEKSQSEELIKSGQNFLGILNDLKIDPYENNNISKNNLPVI